MIRHSRVAITLGALVVAAVTWQGCQSTPTSPIFDPTPSLQPAATTGGVPDSEWHVVATAKFPAGQDGTLSGSRYTLTIPKGALHNAVTLTISERHPSMVDVAFGPDGMTFSTPVTLSIDYSGTAFDTAHDGTTSLHVYGYDEVGSRWVRMSGTDDASSRVYTTQLAHFSRYTMSDAVPNFPSPGHNRRQQGEDLEAR